MTNDKENCTPGVSRSQKARRRVEDGVDSVQMKIAAFVDSTGRPRDVADRAGAISSELEALKAKAVELGEEEMKFDGYTSGSLVALVSIAGSVVEGARFVLHPRASALAVVDRCTLTSSLGQSVWRWDTLKWDT